MVRSMTDDPRWWPLIALFDLHMYSHPTYCPLCPTSLSLPYLLHALFALYLYTNPTYCPLCPIPLHQPYLLPFLPYTSIPTLPTTCPLCPIPLHQPYLHALFALYLYTNPTYCPLCPIPLHTPYLLPPLPYTSIPTLHIAPFALHLHAHPTYIPFTLHLYLHTSHIPNHPTPTLPAKGCPLGASFYTVATGRAAHLVSTTQPATQLFDYH